jgi:hypothetical protein
MTIEIFIILRAIRVIFKCEKVFFVKKIMENNQKSDFSKILKGLRTEIFANLVKIFFIGPGIELKK